MNCVMHANRFCSLDVLGWPHQDCDRALSTLSAMNYCRRAFGSFCENARYPGKGSEQWLKRTLWCSIGIGRININSQFLILMQIQKNRCVYMCVRMYTSVS